MKTTCRMTSGRAPFIAATLFAVTVGAVTCAGLSEGFFGHRVFAQSQDQGPDPADANMAPIDNSQQSGQSAYAQQPVSNQQSVSQTARAGVVNESQQQAAEYSQQGAPIERRDAYSNGSPTYSSQGQNSDRNYDPSNDNYEQQVDAGQEALESEAPPPPLPVYEQPEAPAPDYLWTPGYWGWMPVGYYWVPGAWCAAPYQGALWTPGYWGYYSNRYRFHHGFWGPHIGFYGGVNYGFGYFGTGYYGGYWNGPHFYYNRSLNRINASRITYVYNRTYFDRDRESNRISYNGGRGGIQVRPRPAELIAMRGPRNPPMNTQLQMQRQASENRNQFYNQNRGRPAIVAASRPVMADRDVRPMPVMQARPIQQGNRPAVQQPGLVQGQPGNRPYQQQNANQTTPYQQNGQQNGRQNGNDQRPYQGNGSQNGYPDQGGRFPPNRPTLERNSSVTRPTTELGAPPVMPMPEQQVRSPRDRQQQSQDGFRRQPQQPLIQQQVQPQQQQARPPQDMREQRQTWQEMRQEQQRQQPDVQRQQQPRPDMQRQQEMRQQQQQQPRPEMQRPQEMRQQPQQPQPQMRQQENRAVPQSAPAPAGSPRR